MKLLPRLAPLFVFALIAGCAQQPSRSHSANAARRPDDTASAPTYAPADGGFSVRLPGSPHEQTDPNGSHVYAVEVGDLTYIIGYNDLPAKVQLTDAIRERVLDASREMMVQKSAVKVLSERNTTLDGHPGRELQLQTREGDFMQLKTAFSGTRLYQVAVVAPMKQYHSPEITRFIDSFRFVKQ